MQQNTTEPTLPKESEGTQNDTQSQESNSTETASADKNDDEEETVKQSPSFTQEPGFTIDFSFRLTPKYKTPIIPDVPEIGERQYAGCRIADITTLGLMTLKMNETVIIHDDYNDLTLQDFDVVFQQNSEEEEQSMSFRMVSITAGEIKVQLTFENPILVS